MGFEQTLRWVQAMRALAIIVTCVSVIMFAFIVDMRFKARRQFIKNIQSNLPGLFEEQAISHSSLSSLALVGLAISLAWDGLCMFDLCVKKHYRFDRRVCIFLDMIVAVALLVTGFLNFAYDVILYFTLSIAPASQVRLEVAAVIFLLTACLLHLAFFCYGCRDPAASALEFEHVPLDHQSPKLGHHDYIPRSLRSRANTVEQGRDLVEIDLGKKVQIIRLQANAFESVRTPPRTPREESEAKRLGFIGTPDVLAKRTPEPESAPFLNHTHDHTCTHQSWI